MTSIETMTGPELVKFWNDNAPSVGKAAVKKFKDLATARTRVAQLAKEIKPAKAAKAAKAKELQPRDKYGCLVGSNRAKLFSAINSSKDKTITVPEALTAVYGSANPANMGPLTCVLKGLILCAPNAGERFVQEGAGRKATYSLVTDTEIDSVNRDKLIIALKNANGCVTIKDALAAVFGSTADYYRVPLSKVIKGAVERGHKLTQDGDTLTLVQKN